MDYVHFASFGEDRAVCGIRLPANLSVQLDMQDYSMGQGFTVQREKVTCEACREQLCITDDEDKRVPLGSITATYYIDTDGKRKMSVASQGALDEITLRGMLDTAKDWVVDIYDLEEDDEDE